MAPGRRVAPRMGGRGHHHRGRSPPWRGPGRHRRDDSGRHGGCAPGPATFGRAVAVGLGGGDGRVGGFGAADRAAGRCSGGVRSVTASVAGVPPTGPLVRVGCGRIGDDARFHHTHRRAPVGPRCGGSGVGGAPAARVASWATVVGRGRRGARRRRSGRRRAEPGVTSAERGAARRGNPRRRPGRREGLRTRRPRHPGVVAGMAFGLVPRCDPVGLESTSTGRARRLHHAAGRASWGICSRGAGRGGDSFARRPGGDLGQGDAAVGTGP